MSGLLHQVDGLMERPGRRVLLFWWPSLLPRGFCELKGSRLLRGAVCAHVNWDWWLCPQRGRTPTLSPISQQSTVPGASVGSSFLFLAI